MTQIIYPKPLESFNTKYQIENNLKNLYGDIIQFSPNYIRTFQEKYHLNMFDRDIHYFWQMFTNKLKRNITNAELLTIGQITSEHCRHRFFNGKYKILKSSLTPQNQEKIKDRTFTGQVCLSCTGEDDNSSLFNKIQIPWLLNRNNSILAFKDNASAICGYPNLLQLGQNINHQLEIVNDYEYDHEISPSLHTYVRNGFMNNRKN